MEFVKNKVQEIWGNQAFVSSQMDGVESRLVTLEKVAASFSHFIIEHWVPAQAILIDLHNSTCPLCQRADAMAFNWGSVSKSVQSCRATPIPVPLPNSRQGEASSLISPVPSLISDSSAVLLCGRKTEVPRKIGPLRIYQRSDGLDVVLLRRRRKGSWKQ